MSITEQRFPSPAPPRTLGDLIYKARKIAGLNRKELALQSRVSRNSIAAYEEDERVPRVYMLEAIAKATRQPWLLDYTHLCRGGDGVDDDTEGIRMQSRCSERTAA